MFWAVIIGLVLLILLFGKKANKSVDNYSNSRTENIEVPVPGIADDKRVIDFISIYDRSVIKQTYEQLIQKGIIFPEQLRLAFAEKINKGYITKEDYYWRISIEDKQVEDENLIEYTDKLYFELKGVHVSAYRKKIKNCVIYEKVQLIKDPNNKYDKNAIKVIAVNGIIGHVPAEETELLQTIISGDHKAFIEDITNYNDYLDVTIIVYYSKK